MLYIRRHSDRNKDPPSQPYPNGEFAETWDLEIKFKAHQSIRLAFEVSFVSNDRGVYATLIAVVNRQSKGGARY